MLRMGVRELTSSIDIAIDIAIAIEIAIDIKFIIMWFDKLK